jgi:hypothetical protein
MTTFLGRFTADLILVRGEYRLRAFIERDTQVITSFNL